MKTPLLFFKCMFIAFTLFSQVPTTNLIKEYTFTNGSIVNTINPGSYDLTITTPVYSQISDPLSNANSALSLNGNEFSAGLHPNTAIVDADFSVSFWVNTSSNSATTEYLFSQRESNGGNASAGIRAYIQSGILYFGGHYRLGTSNYSTETTVSSRNIADGNWHHIVITGSLVENVYPAIPGYNLSKYDYRIYIDNSLEGSGATTESLDYAQDIYLFDDTSILSIGSSGYMGGLDNFRMYTSTLSLNDIERLYMELKPCIINIPDTNFKAALVANTNINTNGDTEISCAEATAFSGTMDLYNSSISDLTGIEAFTNLTRLVLTNNSLTTIDLSNNTNLERLYCENNSLTSLDVTNNSSLSYLYCENNALTSLDLSLNSSLSRILCNNNSLTSLNVANGNNASITSQHYFNATNNNNLTCIQVDDVAYSTTTWTFVNSQQFFSINCGNTASIVDTTFNNTINMYPNPVKNSLTINLAANEVLKEVQVFTILGKKVITQNTKTIDFTPLMVGLYIVKIENENGKIAVRRVVKE